MWIGRGTWRSPSRSSSESRKRLRRGGGARAGAAAPLAGAHPARRRRAARAARGRAGPAAARPVPCRRGGARSTGARCGGGHRERRGAALARAGWVSARAHAAGVFGDDGWVDRGVVDAARGEGGAQAVAQTLGVGVVREVEMMELGPVVAKLIGELRRNIRDV